MSEQEVEQPTGPVGELEDFFGSGGGGYPVITFDEKPKGSEFTGVVLPVSADEPTKGHKTTAQTNTKGQTLYWPKNDPKDPNELLRPRPQAEINLQTDFRAREFMSDKAVERAKERDQDDDGLRRWIVKGPSAPKAFKEALKAAGVNGPIEVGSRITVKMANKVENTHGGKSYVFDVKVDRPTAETRKVVDAWLAKQASESAEQAAVSDEEPPF